MRHIHIHIQPWSQIWLWSLCWVKCFWLNFLSYHHLLTMDILMIERMYISICFVFCLFYSSFFSHYLFFIIMTNFEQIKYSQLADPLIQLQIVLDFPLPCHAVFIYHQPNICLLSRNYVIHVPMPISAFQKYSLKILRKEIKTVQSHKYMPLKRRLFLIVWANQGNVFYLQIRTFYHQFTQLWK